MLGTERVLSGGIDWAFVIKKDLFVPDWVENLAKDMRGVHPQNIFLTEHRNFTGKETFIDGKKIEPKPGEEFGLVQRLLLVGDMIEKKGQWTFKSLGSSEKIK